MKPRHNSIIPVLLAVLLLAACSPLRRTQRNRKADSTAVDRTEIRKAVHDILHESGTLSQTVVEFFPPVVPPTLAGQEANNKYKDSVGAALPATAPAATQPPAIRRVIHTEIAAEREQETTTDSLANNDIHTTSHTELEDKVAEKPPAVTSTIKWIAIALAAVAVIILLLKFPKIKLPF